MHPSESRFVRSTAREFAVLAVAAIAAWLFLYHEALYLRPGTVLAPFNLDAFLLVTTVLYLFLRLVFLVGAFYLPRPRREYVMCPECGRELDDASPEGAAKHRRMAITPKPTEREVLAAVMLRKAIDDARNSAKHDLRGPKAPNLELLGEVENLPVPIEEFERILRDLDGVRSSRDPDERRPGGPSRGRD